MTIYIDKEEYNFTSDELESMYLSEGLEADIYYFKQMILKIHKENISKARLDYSTFQQLSQISTERILMPQYPILDHNGDFCGYTEPFIYSYSIKNIANMKINMLLQELELIKEDLNLLANNKIDVTDLTTSNTLFTGNIYLCDPGSYLVRNNKTKEYINYLNENELSEYLNSELFPYIVPLTRNQKKYLIEKTSYYSGFDYLKEANNQEKVSTFIKRFTR